MPTRIVRALMIGLVAVSQTTLQAFTKRDWRHLLHSRSNGQPSLRVLSAVWENWQVTNRDNHPAFSSVHIPHTFANVRQFLPSAAPRLAIPRTSSSLRLLERLSLHTAVGTSENPVFLILGELPKALLGIPS